MESNEQNFPRMRNFTNLFFEQMTTVSFIFILGVDSLFTIEFRNFKIHKLNYQQLLKD